MCHTNDRWETDMQTVPRTTAALLAATIAIACVAGCVARGGDGAPAQGQEQVATQAQGPTGATDADTDTPPADETPAAG